MSKEDKIPYLVENKERNTFTIYVKGTKPYLDLQQRIDKAIEYIKKYRRYCSIGEEWFERSFPARELLEILGDKEDIEFDVLKALNTDLPDDIEMG